MKVGIIGGGIAGLATAVALGRAGADVTVFERSTAPAAGAGISLFGNGLRALASIGLADEIRALGAPPELPAGLRTPSGRWLQRSATSGVDLAVVHRVDLHHILAAAAPAVRQVDVLRVVGSADAATVELGGGEQHTFDWVIGADGIGGRTRRSWPDDPGIRYAGYTAWRGVTVDPVQVPAAGETWGRGERFGIAPLGDGRVYWFAVASVPRDWIVPDHRAELLRRFGGWHDPIPALIAGTPEDALLRNDIVDLAAPLDSFVRDRVVLIGDAAHAMTPNLGQGGNQALEDAATIGALVARHADAVTAFAEYDRLRTARTRSVARMSWQMGRIGQLRGTLAAGARDTLFRMVPSALANRGAARVQAWQPPDGGGR